jgi:uncharacterized LabA/DUF88 family protein/cold shock CspA family protein
MLKAGIFLDMQNLVLNGGWGMRFDQIKSLVLGQDAVVLRANAYITIDKQLEEKDAAYREKSQGYRDAIRRNGFHTIAKEVKRYRDEDGQIVLKANSDLDLAVDAILQAENLDYVLIGSGDGDFIRLVRALQNKGKRVDILAFENVSKELKREADHYFPGAIIPGILPLSQGGKDRLRGILNSVNEERGFGFLTIHTGLGVSDIRDDVFVHISQIKENGEPIENATFSRLGKQNGILEFRLGKQPDGKLQAEEATIHSERS